MVDGALARVLRRAGGDVAEVLERLPGADLTTLLLAVMRRRSARVTASDVLRRYREDRFVAPAAVSAARLRAAEAAALGALPTTFDVVTLAPVVPLGAHAALGGIDQNNVLATIRGSEVAADPTTGLALEAAVRRRATADVVRLAASQRVLRAQRFDGPASFAHFTLLGLVSAGRDTGELGFERGHLAEHLRIAADAIAACTSGRIEVRLTVLHPRYDIVAESVRTALPDVTITDDPERQAGRRYYTGLCFKLLLDGADVGDGGFVGWTQALLADRKERLLTTGIGLERLALGEPQQAPA